ncbi:MAG TPA: aminoacyl-tRNA hydrolase [Candidatus Polarisedimenticolaceae bacterium]|nr:aminoacyl-tRNA hydrolase [Candidatus Polarisedimenticolaceae bacterium]
MRLVLGLGNDGPEYRWTRHNAGFMVVDEIAARCGATLEARGDLGRLTYAAKTEWAGEPVVLAQPRTLMNRSGQAAAALVRKHALELTDLIVVYDDADLAFGRVRVRPEGGAGGHNGIRSLMDTFGTGAFARVKLGVLGEGRHSRDLADYVLDRFLPDEKPVVLRMVTLAADAVESVLRQGVLAAQAAFNGATA